MLENGYIKIFRSMLKWEWYQDINTKTLFLHLLLTVNYEPQKWRGILINRGQRVASYQTLANETSLSVKSVRTALKHLILTGEVAHESTSTYGVFTVINYDKFQDEADEGQSEGIQGADEGQQRNKAKKAKKEKDESADAPAPEDKPIKHKRGEYGWVKLTDDEVERLTAEYGENAVKYYIAYIDESAQGTKNKNKWSDWNLVIRKAIRDKWGNYIPENPAQSEEKSSRNFDG